MEGLERVTEQKDWNAGTTVRGCPTNEPDEAHGRAGFARNTPKTTAGFLSNPGRVLDEPPPGEPVWLFPPFAPEMSQTGRLILFSIRTLFYLFGNL